MKFDNIITVFITTFLVLMLTSCNQKSSISIEEYFGKYGNVPAQGISNGQYASVQIGQNMGFGTGREITIKYKSFEHGNILINGFCDATTSDNLPFKIHKIKNLKSYNKDGFRYSKNADNDEYGNLTLYSDGSMKVSFQLKLNGKKTPTLINIDAEILKDDKELNDDNKQYLSYRELKKVLSLRSIQSSSSDELYTEINPSELYKIKKEYHRDRISRADHISNVQYFQIEHGDRGFSKKYKINVAFSEDLSGVNEKLGYHDLYGVTAVVAGDYGSSMRLNFGAEEIVDGAIRFYYGENEELLADLRISLKNYLSGNNREFVHTTSTLQLSGARKYYLKKIEGRPNLNLLAKNKRIEIEQDYDGKDKEVEYVDLYLKLKGKEYLIYEKAPASTEITKNQNEFPTAFFNFTSAEGYTIFIEQNASSISVKESYLYSNNPEMITDLVTFYYE